MSTKSTAPQKITFRGHRYVRAAVGRQLPPGATADAEYKKTRSEIDKTMVALKQTLDRHAIEQKRSPKDWGFNGDLSHVLKVLQELLEFSSPTGGV